MCKIKIATIRLLLISFLLVGVFGCIKGSFASSESLLISESSPGIGGADNEFVELYNMGNEGINLKDEKIKLKLIGSNGTATQKTISWNNEIIPAKGYFLFGTGALAVSFDATYGGTLLTKSGGAMILDKDDNILDKITWVDLPSNFSVERINDNFSHNDDLAFDVNQYPNPQNSSYQNQDNEKDEPEPNPEESDKETDEDNEEGNEEEEVCVKKSTDVKINEIFPYPESEKEEDEFVELINLGKECVDLSDWKITDNTNIPSHIYAYPEITILEAGETISIEKDFYLNNDDDTVYLFDKLMDPNNKEIFVDKVSYKNAKKNYFYSFDGKKWVWTSNEALETAEEFADGNYDIRINELLPNPKGDEKTGEYIEIYNGGEAEVDLKNWVLKDLSKTKFTFSKDYKIKPDEYLVLHRDVFKFSLNNSGEESVYLLNPNGKVVSSATYKSAKEDITFSFNGSTWNWSKYLTPSQENKFSSAPKVEVKKVKSGYVGVPVYFEVKIKKVKSKNKDKLKYRWDFDDGSRSYLQNVNHTFKKDGKYKVKLVVDDGMGGVEKSFTIKIKKYPKTAVEITRLLPNPDGNDTGNEWIEIKNNSPKEINLNGWKVATGKEKLINHPIKGDIIIPAGKTFQLTRKDSLFSLNNKETKIELRYPNEKEATKISYKKDKIEDGEICVNEGGSCAWILTDGEEEEESTSEEVLGASTKIENVFESELSKINFSEEFLREIMGKMSKEENDLMEKIYQVHVANNDATEGLIIDLSVGKGLVYEKDDNYRFTHSFEQIHWAAELMDDVKVKILLNTI